MSYDSKLVDVVCDGVEFYPDRLEHMIKYFNRETDKIPFSFNTIDCVEISPVSFSGVEIGEDGDLLNMRGEYSSFRDIEIFCAFYSWAMKKGEMEMYLVGEDGENWGMRCEPQKFWTLETEIKYVKSYLERIIEGG